MLLSTFGHAFYFQRELFETTYAGVQIFVGQLFQPSMRAKVFVKPWDRSLLLVGFPSQSEWNIVLIDYQTSSIWRVYGQHELRKKP
jgi:hypothetical protein